MLDWILMREEDRRAFFLRYLNPIGFFGSLVSRLVSKAV